MFLFIVSSCNNAFEEPKLQRKFIKVETVKDASKADKLVFNGIVKEKSLVSLSFRIAGPITTFNVRTGDYVKKGDVIAEIDKRDYRLQIQSTEAQYKQLKSEYERYKDLFGKGKIPANSYEKIESGYLMAKTAYENAVNQLNDTELQAPFSGYIYEKMAENYQTVGAGQPIVSVIDLSSLEVVIGVPENQILDLRGSAHAFLEVKNANVKHLPAEIVSIAEKAGQDGLYEVKLLFQNNPELNVSPGMTAEVTMYIENTAKLTIIPSKAVFYENSTPCVWIYNDKSKTVSRKEIAVYGFKSEGSIGVREGLSMGDSIVTSGVSFLNDGERVELILAPSETNIGGLL